MHLSDQVKSEGDCNFAPSTLLLYVRMYLLNVYNAGSRSFCLVSLYVQFFSICFSGISGQKVVVYASANWFGEEPPTRAAQICFLSCPVKSSFFAPLPSAVYLTPWRSFVMVTHRSARPEGGECEEADSESTTQFDTESS